MRIRISDYGMEKSATDNSQRTTDTFVRWVSLCPSFFYVSRATQGSRCKRYPSDKKPLNPSYAKPFALKKAFIAGEIGVGGSYSDGIGITSGMTKRVTHSALNGT